MNLEFADADLVVLFHALFEHAAGLAQGEARTDRAWDALCRFMRLTEAAGIPPTCQRWSCDSGESCLACTDAIDSIFVDFFTTV